MWDTEGYVSKANGENIFLMKNNAVKTTSLTSVLPGPTRSSVITVARDMGFEVKEAERFTRDELHVAEKAFFTGIAAEVTPVTEVHGRAISTGKRGLITAAIQKKFLEAARGMYPEYQPWLTYL